MNSHTFLPRLMTLAFLGTVAISGLVMAIAPKTSLFSG